MCIFVHYTSHLNSFENLQTPIMLCGDFNSRTGKLLDYVPDKRDENLKNHLKVTAQIVSNRKSSDSEINNHGEKLINLCKENNLRIINGRCLGDSFDQCTFFRQGAKIFIDYTVTSDFSFDKISGLIIKPLNILVTIAKYLQILISLQIQKVIFIINKWKKRPNLFHWNRSSTEAYRAAFSNKEMKAKVQNFLATSFTNNSKSIENANRTLTDIMIDTAKDSLPMK